MIKYIEIRVERSDGVDITSVWCHPSFRSKLGKTTTNPLEWFKDILLENGYPIDFMDDGMTIENPPSPRHINGEYDG